MSLALQHFKGVLLAQTYVLNDRQRLLPVGVPGRLYVSGACLARGILRRPQQTAERFIANPFFDPFGDPPVFSRMVDTGILALWRPDGSLEFGGFASRQVCILSNPRQRNVAYGSSLCRM